MIAEFSSIAKAVRHLHRLRPTEAEFLQFREALAHYCDEVERLRTTSVSGALEEPEKGLLNDLLRDTFYRKQRIESKPYQGNSSADLTIRSAQDNTLVLIECKSGTNKAEMVSEDNLITKAFLEAVVYYCFEKDLLSNDHLKRVVITNSRTWFIFDAQDFRAATWDRKPVRELFQQWRKGNLDSSSTKHLYDRLKQILSAQDMRLSGVHFDLWSFRKHLKQRSDNADRELLKLWRLLHPAYLLKDTPATDSNTLNKNFYHELLYILGLKEVKVKGRKLIQRLPPAERQPGALVEQTIARLESEVDLGNIPHIESYGATPDEQRFNVAMELCTTWLNRVLFLKLLEAQLLRFHGGDERFAFLDPKVVREYDQLNSLFFDVMAVQRHERRGNVAKTYAHIPYLNSTLFTPTALEGRTLRISGLRNDLRLPFYGRTVLSTESMARQEPSPQEYLLRFLQAYDFGSTTDDAVQADQRPLITASVLGLIFEKINGYRDGSFYTPGYITMYMCRETIRHSVLQRFNEDREAPFATWPELANYCAQQFNPELIRHHEGLIDTLRICDPAVGSGHFLVSALNELIAIKSELGLLTDTDGKRVADHLVEVVHDELIVTNRNTGEVFNYTVPAGKAALAPDKQRIQSALFEQKRRIIEQCLFGVDINPNSVGICRLRLWIELLKNAYYSEGEHGRELRTLPNIDINIKLGNSVLMRYPLSEDISKILDHTKLTVQGWLGLVADYQHATDRDTRGGLQKVLEGIEAGFTRNLDRRDPRKQEHAKLTEELWKLSGGLLNVEHATEQARAKAAAKREKLELRINKLQEAMDRDKAGLEHKLAFDWRYRFPQVLQPDTGAFRGFDVVLGNPPYIRQEEIKALKPYLTNFLSFHSTADLFVYFMELGHKLLAPGGHFCYIVANKWMRAGYGEKLRRLLGEEATLLQLVDFGDLPVFEDATTYPCILLTRQGPPPKGHSVQAITMPALHSEDLHAYVQAHALHLLQRDLVRNDYRIATDSSNAVLEKIRTAGVPLGQYLEGKIYRGVLTGYNEAFVIDGATRARLIAEDAKSAEVIKPFLVGRDLERYTQPKYKRYLILFAKGSTSARFGPVDEELAFHAMVKAYPAIMAWLLPHADKARVRTDQGEYWWELRACDYYDKFEEDKILYPDIAPHPEFMLATGPSYCGNTCYFIPSGEKALLAVLNSKVFAYYYASVSTVMRGGYFRFFSQYVENTPIPPMSPEDKAKLDALVSERLAGNTAMEKEIDAVVYGLYGLGEDEVRVVEGG